MTNQEEINNNAQCTYNIIYSSCIAQYHSAAHSALHIKNWIQYIKTTCVKVKTEIIIDFKKYNIPTVNINTTTVNVL